MLTPHIVRVLDLTEEDLRPFMMGRDLGTAAGGSFDTPGQLPPPPAQNAAPPQSNQPGQPRDSRPRNRPAHADCSAVVPNSAAAASLNQVQFALMAPDPLQLIARAAAHGGRTAIVDAGRRYTYVELLDASARVAQGLLNRQDGPPEGGHYRGLDDLHEARVAFLVMPGFDHVAVQWGIWRAGGLAVPLPVTHPVNELDYLIRDSDATIVVADEAGVEKLQPLAVGGRRAVFITGRRSRERFDAGCPDASRPSAVAPERRAMMVYTSGTTRTAQGGRHHARQYPRADSFRRFRVGVDLGGPRAAGAAPSSRARHHQRGVQRVVERRHLRCAAPLRRRGHLGSPGAPAISPCSAPCRRSITG